MVYHVPSDKEILVAVENVFQNYHIVPSQHQLKKLVEKELQGKKKQYHVSERRLRTLILNNDLAYVEIHTREGDPDKLLHRCPVCSGPLERVKNRTIYGGEVTLEFRCTLCGYWTGKKKKIPTLYVFHRK